MLAKERSAGYEDASLNLPMRLQNTHSRQQRSIGPSTGVSLASTPSELCARCRVLEFDDRLIGKKAGSDESGFHLQVPPQRSGVILIFPLDFTLEDQNPLLPVLSASAQRGCGFCHLLQMSIQKHSLSPGRILCRYLTMCWNPFEEFEAWGDLGLISLRTKMILIDESGARTSINLRFLIDGPTGAPCSKWLGLQSPPRPQTLCDQNLTMLRGWAPQMDKHYAQHAISPEFYPTRLIEVGHGDSLCRLIETNSDAIFLGRASMHPKARYATLSYCWGSQEDAAKQFKTENTTFREMQLGFDHRSTSPVILDAIRIARILEIPYLWIDAICIIQGDASDWERESAQMAHIYRHSYVTICTPGSTSCQQGFLQRDYLSTTIKFHSREDDSIRGCFNIRQTKDFTEEADVSGDPDVDFSDSSWYGRGWTYQEYKLSQRLLVFGGSKLYYLADNLLYVEGEEEVGRIWDRIDVVSWLHEKDRDEAWNGRWADLIEDFSGLNLTYHSDKLPALAGLASLAFDNQPEQYVAGLRKNNIQHDLLWSCAFPRDCSITQWGLVEALVDRERYVAPSWSWASRVHGVIMKRISSDKILDSIPEYQAMEISAKTTGENPFGQVSEGSLVLTTAVVPLPHEVRRLATNDRLLGETWRADKYGEYFAYLKFDWTSDSNIQRLYGLSLVLLGSRGTTIAELEDEKDIFADETESWGSEEESEEEEKDPQREAEEREAAEHEGKKEDVKSEEEHWEEKRWYAGSGVWDERGDDLTSTSSLDNSRDDESERDAYSTNSPVHHAGSESDQIDQVSSVDTFANQGTENKRQAYGLVIHPAGTPGKYFRVGNFISWPRGRGGLVSFQSAERCTVEII